MDAEVIDVEDINMVVYIDGPESETSDAAVYADFHPVDLEMEDKMWMAYQWNDALRLRNQLLEIYGIISKVRYADKRKIYTVRVEDFVIRNRRNRSSMEPR